MDEKVMVTREWLYTKILDASQKKYHGKLCGLVLAGGTGAGKTTLCRQIQVSGVNNRYITQWSSTVMDMNSEDEEFIFLILVPITNIIISYNLENDIYSCGSCTVLCSIIFY